MLETRKLAAIMFTDIVGYSALMSKDEKLAMEVLEKNRQIHKDAISKHHGQYIKEIGDGTLSIFQSTVDAINCAMEIQKTCCQESTFQVRIGIHIGDIIFRDNDVFGDGVNIASRIESSGDPGGIYFSERVYEDIKNKTDLRVEFIGEKNLKNIDHSVKIYALREDSPGKIKEPDKKPGMTLWFRQRRYAIIIASIILCLLCILYVIYTGKPKDRHHPDEKLIAVANFENKTGDQSLDPIGMIASDWITQGISETGLVSVVPSVIVTSTGKVHQNLEGLRSLAKKTNAQTIISGVYYKQNENLQFYAHIVDAGSAEVLTALGPISEPAGDPMKAIEGLRQKILGALGAYYDERFKGYSDRTATPPVYDAYQEFLSGLSYFYQYEYKDAILHFSEAYNLDTTFLLPLLWETITQNNLKRIDRVDSLLGFLNVHRVNLTAKEQYFLDFLNAHYNGDLEGTYLASKKGAPYIPILKYQYIYDAIQANHPREAIRALLITEPDEVGFEGYYWDFKGMAYHMLGDYKKELKVAREGRIAHPELFTPIWNELKALAAMGKIEEINKLYKESLAMPKPNDWTPGEPGWLMYITAQELYAHGYFEEATRIINKSITWYNSNLTDENRFFLAQAYYFAGQRDQAEILLDSLIAENPDYMDFIACKGLIAARKGEIEKTKEIDLYLEAMDPRYVRGKNNCYRSRIAAILGQKEKAMELLQTAFSQGFNSWTFDVYLPELMDFESVWDYPPFVELFKPKE